MTTNAIQYFQKKSKNARPLIMIGDELFVNCTKCRQQLKMDSSNFFRSQSYANGLNSWCKRCVAVNRTKYKDAVVMEEEIDEEYVKRAIEHNKELDAIAQKGFDRWYWETMIDELEREGA